MTSIEGGEVLERRLDPGLVAASVGFVGLMLLAVAWPSPVLWVNDWTIGFPLRVDDRAFLGREAPSWDVGYWCIAGLYLLAMLHGRIERLRSSLRAVSADLRAVPANLRRAFGALPVKRAAALVVPAGLGVAAVWWFLDGPLVAIGESIQSDYSRAVIRLLNRLGGGLNPVMIICFFWIAGMVFAVRRWWIWAIAMGVSGIAGGLLVQIIKVVVGRSRPELWSGSFHFANPSSSSFPSGHTVGAFAIAAVLVFGARSVGLRVAALVIATAVAISRVLAFRHWPSDVVASAIIGLLLGWFCLKALSSDLEDQGE